MKFYLNSKVQKIIGIRTLKTGIGAALAMIIASLLGLSYSLSAGIITILSIQSTKRKSIEIAIKRVIATIIALAIAALLFTLFGYNPIVFGIYILIFIPITVKYELADGIVMASVLVTHLMSEQSSGWQILLNEMGLVVVGAGVALILNLYMPSIEGELSKYRKQIEEDMYELFCEMAESLRARAVSIREQELFSKLREEINQAQSEAYKYANNYLFAKVSPYEKYFMMRNRQLQIMTYMREHSARLFMTYKETEIVAEFALKVASSIKGKIAAVELLEELEKLREYFKKSPLPNTREEFENRATLYQFLNDMEHLLETKKGFKEGLTDDEIEQYDRAY